jgi:hypothetical protein
MDVRNLIKTENIEQELKYMRGGQPAKAFPKEDCTVNPKVDEIEQLKKVSGAYYFYGQMKSEITGAISLAKVKLITRKSTVFLTEQIKLTEVKARVTDKVLEHIVNVDSEVVKIKESIAELEKAENKLEIIIKALLLKQDDLIEISRRKKQELKSINNLV